MRDHLDTPMVEHALRRLGEVIQFDGEIEMLIVGGAAAMVTGALPRSRVTVDCDVMVYRPESASHVVETAASQVATELGLPPRWLNSDVQIRRDALPDEWERRAIPIGSYGSMQIFAASRLDLIAMKILAGRDQDVEDLIAMRIGADDFGFVRSYLDRCSAKGTSPAEIAEARELLASFTDDRDD